MTEHPKSSSDQKPSGSKVEDGGPPKGDLGRLNRRKGGLPRREFFGSARRRVLSIVVLCCAAWLGFASEVGANEDRDPLAKLYRHAAAYERAGELDAIHHLREIWGLYERVDPRKVEATLSLLAEARGKSAALSVYARALVAYARLRRGDVRAAQDEFTALGFAKEFLVVGPFDNEGKAGLPRDDLLPSDEAEPLYPGRAYTGKERPVRFRPTPEVFPFSWIDFGVMMRPQTHICAYATTFVSVGKAARKASVWVGASGAFRLFVNGVGVLEDKAYRRLDIGRLAAVVDLLPGENRITIKVCGAENAPAFSLRLADAEGRPDPSLKARASFERSLQVGENVRRVQALPAATQVKGLGPIAAMRRLFDDKSASASDLEAAARYLVLTQGDDKTAHEARDLATRAVEKKETAERLLLLASLDEDRNSARRNIDRAKALAPASSVEVLMAEARLLRTGPSPRAAFPLYDRVLALDPDHLGALRGRVDLQNAAGLRRTALGTLEAAFARNPHSVLLANMVASQRAQLGLAASAGLSEESYAARRFDDGSHLSEKVELATARNNPVAAQHYLSRLMASDPESLWVYQLSARTHRALGQEGRALLDLEQAHAIAPEDVGILRGLADFKGRASRREEQLAHLREILRLLPQEVDVRQYVEHIEPPEQKPDEKYALPPEQFLKRRHAKAAGQTKRTLRDLTVSTVYENGLSSQFRQVVFQPLTDAAAAALRQYAFQYQADRQTVQLKGARVYRADGSMDEAIESGEGAANDPSISMYTSSRTFYVQFPRLEPGDVVEVRYRVDDVTPRNEFSDYFGEVVYLQSDEPIFDAEYVLLAPKSRKLYIDAKVPGLLKSESETESQRIYRFRADQVPAIEPEPSMPPWSEVLGFVHVSTYPTWDALGAWYWGLAKDQFDLDPETRKLAREITKGKTTVAEKVAAVYGWVVKNTRYVALEFGIYGYKPRRCVQTVARGWGDCKDKATVIVTLLKELGIPAQLVVLRTGMRGEFRSDVPSLAPFDHAIAYVPELDLFLDGTAEYTGSQELPAMDHGALGLLIQEGKTKVVHLPGPDSQKNTIARKLTMQLDKGGAAELTVGYRVQGVSASGFRSRYEAQATRKDRLAQDLGHEFPGLVISEGNGVVVSDLAELERPVELSVTGKAPGVGRPEGARMSLPVTSGVRLVPDYASLSERKQDVRIVGFSTRDDTVEVRIPDGFAVDVLPPTVDRKTRFGSYSVVAKENGGTVTVKSRLELTVDRVKPADYREFRQFCIEADQAMNHRLILAPRGKP